jgi:transforming growth factor-beta-induced protein
MNAKLFAVGTVLALAGLASANPMDKVKEAAKPAAEQGKKLVEDAKKAVDAATTPDIVTIATSNPDFSTLAKLLTDAGLVETLKGKGPFTVFAPTNAAFAKVSAADLEALASDKQALTAVLTYHVVPGNLLAADVSKLTFADSVNGQRLTIDTKDGVVVAGSKVTKADVKASNGVIHVIDTVMLPSQLDIVDTALGAGNFKELSRAIEFAGLINTLKGKGPFTVFAPNDAAFAKLPKAELDAILNDKGTLTRVLTHHVVQGRVFSDQAIAAKTPTSVLGSKLEITTKDGVAFVNGARILKTDINAKNGVIHVIDTVIVPPASEKKAETPARPTEKK